MLFLSSFRPLFISRLAYPVLLFELAAKVIAQEITSSEAQKLCLDAGVVSA